MTNPTALQVKLERKKRYTFALSFSGDVAVTFSKKELQQQPDGREGDLEPRDAVMERIQQRLTELISQEFSLIDSLRVITDSDMLLSVKS